MFSDKEDIGIVRLLKTVPTPAGRHLPYGSFVGAPQKINAEDANIGLLPFGRNNLELEALLKISVAISQGCSFKREKTLGEVARSILERETTFNLNDYSLYSSSSGARGALSEILQQIVTPERPYVVYSTPNWIFDRVVGNIPSAISAVVYATDADQFTEGFVDITGSLDSIAAVILVDPANPLGYRFSREHVEAIEKVALSKGIIPIFDDVFRGMQEPGSRNSASEYSSESVIIETTSKRFGMRGVGATWTLIPKKYPSLKISNPCEGCDGVAAEIASSLYETNYGERVSSFVEENARAFRKGYEDMFTVNGVPLSGFFYQAFPSMPIMTFHLDPNTFAVGAVQMSERLKGVRLTHGLHWLHLKEDDFRGKEDIFRNIILETGSYLRICPTKETPDRYFLAGNELAQRFLELFYTSS